MLRFTTKGAPFDRGEQQGRACRDLILPWFRARLGAAAGIPQADVDGWLERIGNVYPAGLDECRGIAAGLGLGAEDYFRVLVGFLAALPQCTTCGIRDEHGAPLLAKTDDLFAPEVGKNVLETTFPDQGWRHVHFHFAGSIWTVAGMNDCGLAIAMTGIPGPTLDRDGVPSMEGLHTILPACATVEETLVHLKNLPINHYGFSLQIGDAQGNRALVEKTGAGMTVFPEQNGAVLLHTNHILDPDFASKNPPQTEPVLANGRRRYDTARRRIQNLPQSEQGLVDLLKDRSPSGPICQQGEDGLHTDFAVLLMPAQRRFVFWPGPPSSTPPETIRLPSLFS